MLRILFRTYLVFGSGAWIRTKDLQVMSEKPVSSTFDHQARVFSQPDED
jgi:hypothetical protein